MFDLSLFETLVHPRLDLLPQRVHLICLLLNECGLRRNDLLVALLHVSLPLLVLHLLRLYLHLMRLRVLLLARKLPLDRLQIQQFSTQLESEGKFLFEHLPVFFQVADVFLLECADRLLVLCFDLREGIVPALVEVLVFHQVGLLDLPTLVRLVVD